MCFKEGMSGEGPSMALHLCPKRSPFDDEFIHSDPSLAFSFRPWWLAIVVKFSPLKECTAKGQSIIDGVDSSKGFTRTLPDQGCSLRGTSTYTCLCSLSSFGHSEVLLVRCNGSEEYISDGNSRGNGGR